MPITRQPSGATTITGNAVNWYQVRTILSAGKLYITHGIIMSRVATPARLRDLCTVYTGKPYARSRKGLETALADLDTLFKDAHPDTVETARARSHRASAHSGCMIG